MLLKAIVTAALLGASRSAAQNSDGGYWFNQTVDVLTTMQDTYWNGTYWVSWSSILLPHSHLLN